MRNGQPKSYTAPGGSNYPNLDTFGFKWPDIRKLLKEAQDLRLRERETGRTLMELREEVKRDQVGYEKARREALRAGESEPDYSSIVAKEAELEKLEEQVRDYRQLQEETKAAIYATVADNREKHAPEVGEALATAAATIEEQVEELRETIAEVDALSRLAEWLGEPERGFAISPTNTSGLEAVVREARYRTVSAIGSTV